MVLTRSMHSRILGKLALHLAGRADGDAGGRGPHPQDGGEEGREEGREEGIERVLMGGARAGGAVSQALSRR